MSSVKSGYSRGSSAYTTGCGPKPKDALNKVSFCYPNGVQIWYFHLLKHGTKNTCAKFSMMLFFRHSKKKILGDSLVCRISRKRPK